MWPWEMMLHRVWILTELEKRQNQHVLLEEEEKHEKQTKDLV